MQQLYRPPPRDIGLRILALEALSGWRWIVLGALSGLALALAALNAVAPEFTAEMVIGPTARSGLAASGPRAGQGLLVTRPVVESGAGDELLSDFTRFTRILGSVAVAERLAERPGMMARLFPAHWDADEARWRPPPGLLPGARRLLLRLAGRTAWTPPDAEMLARLVRRSLIIEPLGNRPMHRIAFRSRDRDLALDLIAALYEAAEARIRAEAARRTHAQLAHIDARLTEVTRAEHRAALSLLQADLQHLQMMLDVGLPFAADMIEAPSAPALPDWPDPMLLLAVGGLTGTMLALFLVYARARWRMEGPR